MGYSESLRVELKFRTFIQLCVPLLQSEWLELQSEKLGRYQLNKLTGEVHRDPAAIQTSHVVEPQIDLINQAYRQVHTTSPYLSIYILYVEDTHIIP